MATEVCSYILDRKSEIHMSHDFHKDKKTYFKFQYETSKRYLIPFVEEHLQIGEGSRVLEIGCAEAGVLKAFTELGCDCVGIELSPSRVKTAKTFFPDELANGQIQFIARDIYDIDVEKDLDFKFDLVILKDVIEHIHDQAKFMSRVGDFLTENGKIFFGFPPWYMPFGGHQQIARNKWLSRLPYYHLLPNALYKGVLKSGGESDQTIDELLEIKETGISIERFERIVKNTSFHILKKRYYLFNPIYQYKFGLKTREQLGLIAVIPGIRNFLTTAMYYLIEKE